MHLIDCIFPKYLLGFGSFSRTNSWRCDKPSNAVTTTTKKQSSAYLYKMLLEKEYKQKQSKHALGMSILYDCRDPMLAHT